MIRSVLIELALFLAPFVLYGALMLATRGSLVPENWSVRALALCSVAAIALMVVGLFVFEHGRSAEAGKRYVPAEMRDGQFVPGHFE
ncbi:DUF6111 family protein [Xanthobacter tagetidis]|jgi:hypothetical protein|uniref:Uncharacterized protein n=1 Tax=Xanthobacter tagetidis TaxID=60216 RepID=A0A3L7A7U2_9HYPH|nr:DUF6111 family protein [Xanthobacter tagetidis]MBB6308359.1 hypothetical protein [Xanthobacter tagetidis]RLP76227.1 hypothetical protein D9R14_15540 [Xanthobacter tagetidis]